MNVLSRYLGSAISVIFFSLAFMPIPAAAGTNAGKNNAMEVYGAVNDYSWQETDTDGSRLMKESGTLFAVGFGYKHEFPNLVTLKPGIEVFGKSRLRRVEPDRRARKKRDNLYRR